MSSTLLMARVTKSRVIMREYLPVITKFTDIITDQELAQQHSVDIPCVEVNIPERDWNKIVEIIEAHERTTQNPVMADAGTSI